MEQRARRAAYGVLAGILALCAVDYATFHVGAVQRADADIYNQFVVLQWRPHVQNLATAIANLADPTPYVWLCAIPIVIALCRGRRGLAATIPLIIVGADLSTELLKRAVHQSRDVALIHSTVIHPQNSTWPSGHSTAAMALALCLVLAAAPRWRPWAALVGAGFTLAVIYSLLALGWHYVSDVVGGLLMAGTWTFFGVFVRSVVQARQQRRDRTAEGERTGEGERPERGALRPAELLAELGPILVGALAAGAVAGAVVLARPAPVLSFAADHEHLLAAILLIASVAVTLVGSLLVMLRRAPRL